MWQYRNPDELYHYGILGMRWGHHKAVMAERKKDKMNRLQYKYDKKAKAKSDYIKKVDDKVNKYGVKKVVNTNRAKMLGYAALPVLAGVGVAATGLGIKYAKSPAFRSAFWMTNNKMEKSESLVKSLSKKWYKPISKMKANKQYREAIADGKAIMKPFLTAASIAAAAGRGIAISGIYQLHKENKTAKDYDYRQYANKKTKSKKK